MVQKWPFLGSEDYRLQLGATMKKERWQETPQGQVIVGGVKELCERFWTYLENPQIREEFFMQEIDGAFSGDSKSKKWVKNLGIPKERWKGALENDAPEVERIQQILNWYVIANSLHFKKDMAHIRRNIVSFLLLKFPVDGFNFGEFYERDTGNKYDAPEL